MRRATSWPARSSNSRPAWGNRWRSSRTRTTRCDAGWSPWCATPGIAPPQREACTAARIGSRSIASACTAERPPRLCWRSCRGRRSSPPRLERPAESAAHRIEELLVALRPAHLAEEELHRVDHVEGVQQLTQDPDAVELLVVHEQLLLARAGAVDVEAGEDALLHQLAVEHDLGVARPLELLEDHFVHARAGVDQRGADDGQR